MEMQATCVYLSEAVPSWPLKITVIPRISRQQTRLVGDWSILFLWSIPNTGARLPSPVGRETTMADLLWPDRGQELRFSLCHDRNVWHRQGSPGMA
jgi:hypothetical protein